MQCNQAGISLIKSFEGCKLTAYQDTNGLWTIGWGHLFPDQTQENRPPHDGETWTQAQADTMFLSDLAHKAEEPVSHLITATLTDNQFAALCSLCYNIGQGNFASSHVVAYANTPNFFDQVPERIMAWDKNHDGSVCDGLMRRRTAECNLWNTEA